MDNSLQGQTDKVAETIRSIMEKLSNGAIKAFENIGDEIERLKKLLFREKPKHYGMVKVLSKCNGLEKKELWREVRLIRRARSLC